jgi:arginine:ornithine antiporter / lysine permease
MATKDQKVGFVALTAIIIGSMIGGGAFNLPAEMSGHAGTLAVIVAWIITGVGMIFLALIYQNLTKRKPELGGGIYSYAKEGFGHYLGFNSAWGYWLSAFIGNVAYAILLFNTIAFFFPIFGNGSNLYSIIGCSIIVWGVHFIALKGVKSATLINTITTICRLIPLFLFIVIMVFCFNIKDISFNFLGSGLGGFFSQVKSTMMITVWCFIGIEGAVVLSGKAEKMKDVGRATVIGLIFTLVVYVLISVLTIAAIPREVFIKMPNPSVAYALQYVVGTWGAIVINIGLIISLFGALLGWTLLASEVPFVAAMDGVLPKFFTKVNKNGAPYVSLWITNSAIEVFLIISLFSHSTYMIMFFVASVTILPPYLFSSLYGLKIAILRDSYKKNESIIKDLIITIVSSIYGIWLIYAAGLSLLLISTILFAIGLIFYIYARIERKKKVFVKAEWILFWLILICAIYGVFMLLAGKIALG